MRRTVAWLLQCPEQSHHLNSYFSLLSPFSLIPHSSPFSFLFLLSPLSFFSHLLIDIYSLPLSSLRSQFAMTVKLLHFTVRKRGGFRNKLGENKVSYTLLLLRSYYRFVIKCQTIGIGTVANKILKVLEKSKAKSEDPSYVRICLVINKNPLPAYRSSQQCPRCLQRLELLRREPWNRWEAGKKGPDHLVQERRG